MIFCDSYLPGHRGGGGMWAIRNLAVRFCDRYDFYIVTRDCDGKIDGTPYVKIARNKWTSRPEAMVYYASPSNLRSRNFAELVAEVKPDAVYLNSIFSKVCATFLFARKRFLKPEMPVLLAPCGELSDAALNLRKSRKRMFLFFANKCGFFKRIIWKAASESERSNIYSLVSPNPEVKIAPELTPKDILPDFRAEHKPKKTAGSVRFVYFSRVTPIKNLLFLLELLNEVTDGIVDLKVVGPTDDPQYLEKCRQTVTSLPPNIKVELIGSIDNLSALEIAKNSHFMVLPTKNDSFGYVVIESLAAGCPVILSDRTQWTEIQKNNLGWQIPLDDRSGWISTLKDCVLMNNEQYRLLSFSARQFAVKYLTADEPTAANQIVFDSVLAA